MLPFSPRRFKPYICISLILLTLFLSHSIHCIPPYEHRLGIFSDDFSLPSNMRLPWTQKSTPSTKKKDDESNPSASPNVFADIIPTAQISNNNNNNNNNNNKNDNQTKEFAVDNLYEYALKSASFRDGKDVKTLRIFLRQSNAQWRSSYDRS